MVIRTCHWALP